MCARNPELILVYKVNWSIRSMGDLFDTRTQVHRNFGIFRYSDELAQLGIVTPSAQILEVGWFLENVIGCSTDLPDPRDDLSLYSWMRHALSEALQPRPVLRVSSLSRLQQRTSAFLDWDSFGDFAELLNYRCGSKAYGTAATKLRSRGFQTSMIDLLGVTEHFQLSVLPKAVRAFDLIAGDGHEVID